MGGLATRIDDRLEWELPGGGISGAAFNLAETAVYRKNGRRRRCSVDPGQMARIRQSDCLPTGWRCWCRRGAPGKKPLFRRRSRGLHRHGGWVGGRNRKKQSGSAGSRLCGLDSIPREWESAGHSEHRVGNSPTNHRRTGPLNSQAPRDLQDFSGTGAGREPLLPGSSSGILKGTIPRLANRWPISDDSLRIIVAENRDCQYDCTYSF